MRARAPAREALRFAVRARRTPRGADTRFLRYKTLANVHFPSLFSNKHSIASHNKQATMVFAEVTWSELFIRRRPGFFCVAPRRAPPRNSHPLCSLPTHTPPPQPTHTVFAVGVILATVVGVGLGANVRGRGKGWEGRGREIPAAAGGRQTRRTPRRTPRTHGPRPPNPTPPTTPTRPGLAPPSSPHALNTKHNNTTPPSNNAARTSPTCLAPAWGLAP